MLNSHSARRRFTIRRMRLVKGMLCIGGCAAAPVLFASALLAASAPGSSAELPICVARAPVGPDTTCLGPRRLLLEVATTFAPTALPRSRRSPVGFHFESKVSFEGGGHPPALREGMLDLDKHVRIDASKFRACPREYVAHGEIARALRLCSDSVVGVGRARIEVEDPEGQAPHGAVSHLTIFAGGPRGSTTTLLFRFEPLAPSSVPLLAVAKTRVLEGGRFGTRMSIAFPRFAEGSGSIVSLGFRLRSRAPGDRAGVMSASCADGHLVFHFSGLFTDGTRLAGSTTRTCTAAP